MHSTIVWVFLNCFKWYLCIMHMLNKLISTEISLMKSAWSALFKISEIFDALFTFTHLITHFISFFEMREFDDTVKDMNEFEMLWTSAYENEEKNFSCSILIFSSNVVIMWSVSFCFNDKNWESFLNSWLLILTHFAKHHIDFNVSLNSCICDLKCAYFVCLMILFLWLLCFKYSFYVFNMFCVFHMIRNHLDFITTLKQLWFQKFLAQFNDFAQRVDFSIISCNTLMISVTLSFISALLFRKWSDERCIHR